MASGGTIEIDVELNGAQDIKEGLGSIGTAGKSLAASMGVANEKLGEGLEGVGESVFGLTDSLAELKHGMGVVSQTGIKGFTALLGPIGMVVTAGFALFETFKMISGAAQEAEENAQAMAAAASDLQSKLEALSEKGVQPTAADLQKFSRVTIEAQFAKDKLEKAQEKLTKTFQRGFDAEQKLAKARADLAKATDNEKILSLSKELTQATRELNAARAEESKQLAKLQPLQTEVNKKIKAGEDLYKEHEETSAEFLKAKILENIETRKSIQLKEAENNMIGQALENHKIEIERIAELAKARAKANEENQKQLLAQHKALDADIKKVNQVDLANETAERKRDDLILARMQKEKEARSKRRENALKAMREREAQAQKEEALALRVFAEQSRIRQLELESEDDSVEKQIKLAKHRYDTQLKLAKNNLNLARIATLEYNAEIKEIRTKEAQDALEIDKAKIEQAKAFSRETALFNAEQIQNNFERESELLRLNYDNKLAMAKGNQEQITELNRRFGIERQKLTANEAAKSSEKVESFFSNLGRGMAQVAVNSILMGKSFKEATGQLLLSLAQQAGVEALMETARGVSKALNPITAPLAAAHFKAAGIFTAAAVAAGSAGTALGGGGSGGISGGGGGGASPMGSPQTSTAPERQEATSSSMVFNVNFSGAVVYDTKKAAEMALADRITNVMNTQRRGAPRRRS